MSGGAGYILSSATFRNLISTLQEGPRDFRTAKYVAEDAMMGYLMAELQSHFIHLEVKVHTGTKV